MSEGIRKTREGLKLLIDGLLEDTLELSKIPGADRIVKELINYRLGELGGYIKKARKHLVSEEEIEPLEIRYNYLIKYFKSK